MADDELARPEGEGQEPAEGWKLWGVWPHGKDVGSAAGKTPAPQGVYYDKVTKKQQPIPELPTTLADAAAWAAENLELCNTTSWRVARAIADTGLQICGRTGLLELADRFRELRQVIEAECDPRSNELREHLHRLIALSSQSSQPVGRGYLGGSELADALGVPAERREAFLKDLERRRHRLPDADWQEVERTAPRKPKYLYRTDSPVLRAIADRYRQST